MTAGWSTLDEFEKVPTKKEGIFVMPKEPIVIQSTYVYIPGGGVATYGSVSECVDKLAGLQLRFDSLSKEMERIRASKLPKRR